jgi:ubiquinone/menaquinone biosynthesis C-methylase UbiE
MVATNISDFSTVTETPLNRATKEQFQIMYTRYELAARIASGRAVLEVACGAGVGLGLLARTARYTVGGDIDDRNLSFARTTYARHSDIEIMKLDAEQLPFEDGSFDVIVLYEALYYIPSIEAFFAEAHRILRPGGKLLISTVNCRWDEFNPSPFSTRYLDASQLAEMFVRHGFQVEILGGFPKVGGGWAHAVIGFVRKIAVALHLIPKTMAGKEWLKRLFYGELQSIPRELPPNPSMCAPLETIEAPYLADRYRFIYGVGTVS